MQEIFSQTLHEFVRILEKYSSKALQGYARIPWLYQDQGLRDQIIKVCHIPKFILILSRTCKGPSNLALHLIPERSCAIVLCNGSHFNKIFYEDVNVHFAQLSFSGEDKTEWRGKLWLGNFFYQVDIVLSN